jgi:hypothetical protein
MAVQLEIVEGIVIRNALDRLDILIDEHPNALAMSGQISRRLADITARPGPEDEAHHVNA